jgi:hypothetical protein
MALGDQAACQKLQVPTLSRFVSIEWVLKSFAEFLVDVSLGSSCRPRDSSGHHQPAAKIQGKLQQGMRHCASAKPLQPQQSCPAHCGRLENRERYVIALQAQPKSS